jgi:membrane protease YdiL (CAAX protease family)
LYRSHPRLLKPALGEAKAGRRPWRRPDGTDGDATGGDAGYKGRLRAQPSNPAIPRPSPWPAVVAYVAAFVLALVSSVLLVFAVALARTGGQRSRLQAEATRFALSAPGLVAGALGNAVVIAAVALVAARLMGKPIGPRLRVGPSRASLLGFVGATTGMVGLSFACGSFTELLGVRGSGVMDTMAEALQAPSAAGFFAAIAGIGIAPGLAEETFFRGLVQTRLVASWGRWPAIVATSAAFGLIHLDPVQGSLAFVAGLFLGWVVDRAGGVRPTIVAHVTNNAVFVTFASFGSSKESSRGAEIATMVIGVAAWVGSIALLRTRRAFID